MAPISNINSKTYRFSKKVEEVKEVIQNKPDTDIIKVLEYFDNDVGKTIDAFINDDGKEALSKWQAKIKSVNNGKKAANNNKNSQDTDDQQTNNKSQTDENSNQESNEKQNKSKSNNKRNNKKTNSKPNTNNDNQNASLSSLSSRRSNLNDLVASVINQYTSSTPSTPLSSSMNSNIISNVNQQQQANSLSEQLNRLVLNQNNQSLSSSIKVTVLGVQTSSDLLSNTCSSMSSSPLSSSNSTSDKHSAPQQPQQQLKLNGHVNSNNTNNRPMLLDLKQNESNSTSILNKVNMSYVNPNAKELLEKHQKDLQRQTNQLAKIASQFQEEFSKSQKYINETFDKLRELLNIQQRELQSQLMANAQNGYNILQRRQNKAIELKLLLENAQHLNEHQTQELKADIKHFVSERQVDEEFAKIRLIEFANLEKFKQDLKHIGQIIPVQNQYATVRPAELTSPTATSKPIPSTNTKSSEQINGKHHNNQTSKSNGNGNKSTNKLNGDFVAVDNNNNSKHVNNTNGSAKLNGLNNNQEEDNEGEFIEVKKPQRNRNKKPQPQQQQPQEPLRNGVQATNGLTNGKLPYTDNNQNNNKNTRSSNASRQTRIVS